VLPETQSLRPVNFNLYGRSYLAVTTSHHNIPGVSCNIIREIHTFACKIDFDRFVVCVSFYRGAEKEREELTMCYAEKVGAEIETTTIPFHRATVDYKTE
jgi:hypothetical protein